MAYCRWTSDSDIYMYGSNRADFECCGCMLSEEVGWVRNDPQETIDHLKEHQQAGHKVPEYMFEFLEKEKEPKNDQ